MIPREALVQVAFAQFARCVETGFFDSLPPEINSSVLAPRVETAAELEGSLDDIGSATV